MAKGRFIAKQITLCEQVDELSSYECRLAFTWAIPFLDKNGCLTASPKKLKGMVFPLRDDVSVAMMKGFVDEWINSGLVLTYSVNGDSFLIFPSFLEHQTGLRREKEGNTTIPLPPDDIIVKCSTLSTELVRSNDGVSPLEEKRSKEKRSKDINKKTKNPNLKAHKARVKTRLED